jgi:hypothetical protein
MASRGSIPKIMELAGISMIDPQAGAPVVRRVLSETNLNGEIVVGDQLGILLTAPKVDLEREAVAAYMQQGASPLTGAIRASRLYQPVEIETTLDPKVEPFLRDHAIQGTPVMPGVMGLEAFAQAALLLLPGSTVTGFRDVRFLAPLKFYRLEPHTFTILLTVSPRAGGGWLARCLLKSRRALSGNSLPDQEKVHFTANVLLSPAAPQRLPLEGPPASAGEAIGRDTIYRAFFHGPAFQVLETVQIDGGCATGWFRPGLPPGFSTPGVKTAAAPRLVELCFQTAGMWEMKSRERFALPASIAALDLYPAAGSAGERVCAQTSVSPGESGFDARVLAADGEVCLTLSGYRTTVLPQGMTLSND